MRGANKTLKRVFYQSAFASLRASQESRAFYDRKRAEDKRHTQALIAPAGGSTSSGRCYATEPPSSPALRLDIFIEILIRCRVNKGEKKGAEPQRPHPFQPSVLRPLRARAFLTNGRV
jgi:hypothetical protein